MVYPPISQRKYLKSTKYNSYAEIISNKKGTEYICITVADKYLFYFTQTGKTLLEVDDLHLGTWDVYQGQEVKYWLKQEIYSSTVLPFLKMFLKQFPGSKKNTKRK